MDLASIILYLIPVLMCLFGAIEYDINGRRKGGKLLWGVIFVYMTLFMGLRYGVGGDTINYMGDFEWIPTFENYSFILPNRFDPGFNFLMVVGKSITKKFVGFQLLHIVIFNFLLFRAIQLYSKCRFGVFFCTLFIFYYYFTTEILRESLAVLIFVNCYKLYIDKKWHKYILMVIVCGLMHRGALFLLFLPFVSWVKFNQTYVFLYIGTLAVGIALNHVFSILNHIAFIADNSLHYQSDTTHGLLADGLVFLRLTGFPLLVSLLIKYRNRRVGGEFKFENANAILVLLGLLSYFSPIIFARLCNYFLVFFSITLGDIIVELIRKQVRTAHQNAIVLLFGLVTIYGSSFVMYNYYTRLLPYYSVFNPVDVDRDSFEK